MKHVRLITEMYKPATEHEINSFGWKIPVRKYVDDVFDRVQDIICDIKHISEKSFKELDDNKKYVESVFDSNTEILKDIDNMSDKRTQYTAEYIYDKYFKK